MMDDRGVPAVGWSKSRKMYLLLNLELYIGTILILMFTVLQ